MNQEVNQILESTRRQLDEFNKTRDKETERTSAAIDLGDSRSIQNFATWKEYLHKYFVVMLSFLSFVVGLSKVGVVANSYQLMLGIGLLGFSVLVGFLGIHWYMFVERRWIEISTRMAAFPAAYGEKMLPAKSGTSDEQQYRYTNPAAAWRAKNKEEQKLLKEKIKTSVTIQDTKRYRLHLKGYKHESRLIKYVGAQFGGWIERIWLCFVSTSVIVSLFGVGFVVYALMIQTS